MRVGDGGGGDVSDGKRRKTTEPRPVSTPGRNVKANPELSVVVKACLGWRERGQGQLRYMERGQGQPWLEMERSRPVSDAGWSRPASNKGGERGELLHYCCVIPRAVT